MAIGSGSCRCSKRMDERRASPNNLVDRRVGLALRIGYGKRNEKVHTGSLYCGTASTN
jgi:hypothetical protein